LENLLPESGFYWKKDHQDTIFLKINNSREIPRNSQVTKAGIKTSQEVDLLGQEH
jgi:hypothetical protein